MDEGTGNGRGQTVVDRLQAALQRLPRAEREGFVAGLELLAELARDLPIDAPPSR